MQTFYLWKLIVGRNGGNGGNVSLMADKFSLFFPFAILGFRSRLPELGLQIPGPGDYGEEASGGVALWEGRDAAHVRGVAGQDGRKAIFRHS